MRTVYVVIREWGEDWEVVAAFETDHDAQQFMKALEGQGGVPRYSVVFTTLYLKPVVSSERMESLYRWVISDPRPLPPEVCKEVEALHALATK